MTGGREKKKEAMKIVIIQYRTNSDFLSSYLI